MFGIEKTLLFRLTEADPREPTSLDVVRLTDIDRLADIGPCDRAECRGRLRRGDACYAVMRGDELAHYSWVQHVGSHPIDAAGIVVPILEGEFWIYNCRTAEQFRGQGLYPQTLRHITADYFARGFHTAWIYTARHNVPSQRGIARAGFTPYSTLRAFRLGRRHLPLAA